jgi:hypothetical protein
MATVRAVDNDARLLPLTGTMRPLFVLLLAAIVAGCSGANGSNLFACDGGEAPCDDPRSSSGGAREGRSRDDTSPPGTDGGAGVDAAVGGACRRDVECDGGLCNLKLDRCAVPSPNGGPCARDSECTSGLCNLRLDACSDPAVEGAACARDSECAGALCNLRTDRCAPKQPIGAPCARDSECAGSLCNLRTDVCATKGAAGTPCARDSECSSGLCNTAADACR